MSEAQWEVFPCRISMNSPGIITLHGLEPGYEYQGQIHALTGYSVARVYRRALQATTETGGE